MIVLVTSVGVGNNNDFEKSIICSKKWIKKNVVHKKLFDKVIFIDNNFLNKQNININYYLKKWGNSYFIWKPLSILSILEKLKDGDILYYHDSNVIKYPSYKFNFIIQKDKILKFVNKNDSKSLFLFHEGYKPLYWDIKFEALFNSKKNSFKNYDNGIWAGALIIKKNSYSLNLIEKWVELSKSELITKNEYPNISKIFYPRFAKHSQDQAALYLSLINSSRKFYGVKILHTNKRKIYLNDFSQPILKVKDFMHFISWKLKDYYFFLNFLINGQNKYYKF